MEYCYVRSRVDIPVCFTNCYSSYDSIFVFNTVGGTQMGWTPPDYPPKSLDFRMLADQSHREAGIYLSFQRVIQNATIRVCRRDMCYRVVAMNGVVAFAVQLRGPSQNVDNEI